MTIALAKDVEALLHEQVRSGVCENASDLVNDILRSLLEHPLKSFKSTPELEEWLLDAAGKPVSPLRSADFDRIRKSIRAKGKNSIA